MKNFISRIIPIIERVRQDIKCISATIDANIIETGINDENMTSLVHRRADLQRRERMAVRHLNMELKK